MGLPPRIVFDAIIGRAKYDPGFVQRLVQDLGGTFQAEGLIMDQTEVEQFINSNPATFDKISTALLQTLHADFFTALGSLASTCDPIQG